MPTKIDVLLTWPTDGLRLFDSMMPLGIASLAAMLRQNGYVVKIIDFNHYKSDFRLELLKLRPQLVGIGGTTQTRKGSFLTAKLCKEMLPHVPVVYGGPHATFAWEDTLVNVPQIDFVLRGEAEFSLLSLVECLKTEHTEKLKTIPGIAFREKGIIKTNLPERLNDLSLLPMPARDLIPHKYSLTIDHTDIVADFIITSRGCPATCDFCSASRMFPGGVRLRPMTEIEKELQWIIKEKPDVKGIKVFDSTFTANRQHVLDFCNVVKDLDLKWECEIRVDTIDFNVLKMMRDAGCVFVSIGFESTSNRLLKKMGKKITKEQVEQVLIWCKELSIITKVFFTFGHFGQTFKDCLDDLAYLRTCRDFIDFFATTVGIRVYPGTAVEMKMKARGLMKKNFSWVKHNPGLKNLLVLEPADIIIAEPKGLSLYVLSIILFRLLFQGTALSPRYILKMIPMNLLIIYENIRMRLVYMEQRLRRPYEIRKLG